MIELGMVYEIEIPRLGERVPVNDIWVDIETEKVAVKNWVNSRRWRVFMVGLGYVRDDTLVFEVWSGDEDDLISFLEERFKTARRINYSATRRFDEMVLRGYFINARRPFLEEPWRWARIKGNYVWRNIRKIEKDVPRIPDVPSKLIPKLWNAGEKEIVYLHCLKDVVALFLSDPDVELSVYDSLVFQEILGDEGKTII